MSKNEFYKRKKCRFPRRQSDLPFRRIDVAPLSALNQIKINREGTARVGEGGSCIVKCLGCAIRKGILFRTSGLATGMLSSNLSLGKGILFGNFGGNSCIKTHDFGEFCPKKAKIWHFSFKQRRFMALLI